MKKSLFVIAFLLFGAFMLAQESTVSTQNVPEFETRLLVDYSGKYLNEFQRIDRFKSQDNQERIAKTKERIVQLEALIQTEVLTEATENDQALFEEWSSLLKETYQIKK